MLRPLKAKLYVSFEPHEESCGTWKHGKEPVDEHSKTPYRAGSTFARGSTRLEHLDGGGIEIVL